VQSFMSYSLLHFEQTAYLIKLSRSKHTNLRRRYGDDGIMANSSARYFQLNKSESTFKN